MPDSPDLISVETFASSLSVSFLACRELGHHWKDWNAEWSNEERAWSRVLRCPRCRTERVQVINGLGHVVHNRYRYAEGYQAKNVETGVNRSRDVFRLEALQRFMERKG